MALAAMRAQNYADWYQEIIRKADLAEGSDVRGCMIIKPWGFGIWDNIKNALDQRIKETGHDNCYFPLFIPLSYFEKEAKHIDGFAKEMAMVTHTRLEDDGQGGLKLGGKLEEPLVIRPTSETVISESFAKWIQSYRDLPVLINQWANVVRWEMRTRIFLRTSEFLWQEGHTAHATRDEAMAETEQMLEVYREIVEEHMAIPVVCGAKPEFDRFPGAEESLCIEAMMQDGRALQAGTSHYLGQTFAKAANIQFQDKDGERKYVHTTSWGVSTRLMGGLIMTHGDDEGLCVPPRIAPWQVVIVPILKSEEDREKVLAYANKLKDAIQSQTAFDQKIRVKLDGRDFEANDKRWGWLRKGVPLVLEVGPRDIEKNGLAVASRIHMDQKKTFPKFDEFVAEVGSKLEAVQQEMFERAQKRLQAHTRSDINSFDELAVAFKAKNSFIGDDAGAGSVPGFVRAGWNSDAAPDIEDQLKEHALTVRCIPHDAEAKGKCIFSGEDATTEVIISRSY